MISIFWWLSILSVVVFVGFALLFLGVVGLAKNILAIEEALSASPIIRAAMMTKGTDNVDK